jgi:hypothetical protein
MKRIVRAATVRNMAVPHAIRNIVTPIVLVLCGGRLAPAFYISERGRYFPDNIRDKGRHLSAGFHNLMGYFRDDLPLYQMILDDHGRTELDLSERYSGRAVPRSGDPAELAALHSRRRRDRRLARIGLGFPKLARAFGDDGRGGRSASRRAWVHQIGGY